MNTIILRVSVTLALLASMLSAVVAEAPPALAATSAQPKKIAVILMENRSWSNLNACSAASKWTYPYMCNAANNANGVSTPTGDGTNGLTSHAWSVGRFVQANLGTGTYTASTGNLSLATGSFAAGDVGKWVSVAGAGPSGSGADLVTTIASFASSTQVMLNIPSQGSVNSGSNVAVRCDGCANDPSQTSGGYLAGTADLQRPYDASTSNNDYNAMIASAPNYAAMFTGNDCNPSGNTAGATTAASDFYFNQDGSGALTTSVCGNSLLAELDTAGVTWKDYAEGFGATIGCTWNLSDKNDITGDTGNIYVRRHNQGAMFADTATDCTTNGNMVNWSGADDGTQHKTVNDDGGAFSGASLPQFSLVVPADCHDQHTSIKHFPPLASNTTGCVHGTSPTWDAFGTYTSTAGGPEGGTNNGLNIRDCDNASIWDATKHCQSAKWNGFAGDYMLSKIIPDLATDVGPTGVVVVVWDESSSNTTTLQIDNDIPAYVIPGRDSSGNYETLDVGGGTVGTPATTSRYDQASLLRAIADAFGVNCNTLGTGGNSLGQTQCTNATPLPIKLSIDAPTITSLSVSHGRVGDAVTITGTNLAFASAVTFTGTTATFTANNDNTTISTTVPAGGSTGALTVTTPAGSANSSTFTYDVPTVSSFTNDHGNPSTSVILTGTNFTGATAVTLNGTAASYSVTDDTHISVTVPLGATSGVWQITTPSGSGTSSTYTVPSATVIGSATGNSTAPNVNTTAATAAGDAVVAILGSATGNTGFGSRPTGFGATKEVNAIAIDVCANCSAITSGTNLSFTLNTGPTNWTIKIIDVKGLANSAVDLTASYTSGTSSVTTLDSGLTGTTGQASEVVISAMEEASNQSVTFCSPSCTGTFMQVDTTQTVGTNTGILTGEAFPSATSTFESFGTISTAAKARGVVVTLK